MMDFKLFQRWEYMTSFKYILLNFIIFIAFCNCVREKFLLKIHLINFCILIAHYLFYIFLESEFSSSKLKKRQLFLENGLSSITFIITILISINFVFSLTFFAYYFTYKFNIPFIINNFDKSIHYKKRCDLYNVNDEDIYPYKYICSYNAEEVEFPISMLLKKNWSFIKCSEVQYLIDNNEIINSFINEYYKTNIYYCDLQILPYQYSYINPKEDNYGITIFPMILISIYMFLYVRYLILINIYFKNIKPNINMEIDYYDFGKIIKQP
jgi:hypothetical protein